MQSLHEKHIIKRCPTKFIDISLKEKIDTIETVKNY